ncbi:hypothetical protein CYLTODRAFT_452896 [Cylindrobasidium torrendii FP15055 ss-10]|uniref:Uncharacterized protein n=1 Tax=Cylindrobasidium torrendii FP15055 ss-10 TaxID=1314674 RepID=A0A0D7BGG7_9AGAR|nr:hypothetical protein CYLTODRAFT_452896 [Cylindrobasidium torrendii FP15055 ss-10]
MSSPDEQLSAGLKEAYVALHLAGGHIALPILILTAVFAKSVHAHPTLVNLWFSWVVYSVASSFMLYGAGHTSDERALCQASQTLIHSTGPMTTTAGLMVVYQIWHTIEEPSQMKRLPFRSKWSLGTKVSLAIPYIVLVAFSLTYSLYGTKNPANVILSQTGLYCSLDNSSLFMKYGATSYCAFMLASILVIEAAILVRFGRMWSQISRIFPLASRNTSFFLIFRVAVFTLYSVVAFSVAALLAPQHDPSGWPYLVQASVPLAAAVVFGTQSDILNAWLFWRKEPSRPATPRVHVDLDTVSVGSSKHMWKRDSETIETSTPSLSPVASLPYTEIV